MTIADTAVALMLQQVWLCGHHELFGLSAIRSEVEYQPARRASPTMRTPPEGPPTPALRRA